MPDDDVQRPRRARTRSTTEPGSRGSRGTQAADDGGNLDHLPDAAREIIRQPADPRLDAHLARMGLLPDADADAGAEAVAVDPGTVAPEPPASAGPASELDGLRAELSSVQAALDGARRRISALSILLVVATIVVVILLIAALIRHRRSGVSGRKHRPQIEKGGAEAPPFGLIRLWPSYPANRS